MLRWACETRERFCQKGRKAIPKREAFVFRLGDRFVGLLSLSCFGFCCRVGRPTMLRMLSNAFVSIFGFMSPCQPRPFTAGLHHVVQSMNPSGSTPRAPLCARQGRSTDRCLNHGTAPHSTPGRVCTGKGTYSGISVLHTSPKGTGAG